MRGDISSWKNVWVATGRCEVMPVCIWSNYRKHHESSSAPSVIIQEDLTAHTLHLLHSTHTHMHTLTPTHQRMQSSTVAHTETAAAHAHTHTHLGAVPIPIPLDRAPNSVSPCRHSWEMPGPQRQAGTAEWIGPVAWIGPWTASPAEPW